MKRYISMLVAAIAFLAMAGVALAQYRGTIFANNYGNGPWVSLTASGQSLISVTFSLPGPTKVYVEGSGYGYHSNAQSEWAIGIGPSAFEDEATRRFYNEEGISQAMGVQTSKTYSLQAGTHIFHLLGSAGPNGTVEANYFTISAHIFETGNVNNGNPPAGDLIPMGSEDGR
jgi:hypothetical protein